MSVADWSTDPNANTTVGGINIAENCPAGNINGALREMMAEVAQFSDDLGDDFQAKNNNLTALAGLTLAANQLPYATGAGALALTALTPFMRTLLDDADASAAAQTLGAVRIAGLSLGNPGYVRLQVGASSYFQIAWGIVSIAKDTALTVSYPLAFPNASFPIVCAMSANAVDAGENTGYASGTATVSGFQLRNAENATFSVPWLAVGY